MLGDEERQAQKSLKFEFQSLQGRFYMHLRKCSSFFSFSFFLQMTITKKNNNENASPSTPWCEYLQNVEIHCKSALTLFRLRFCKAAIFMAWPQRRARKTQKKSKIFSTWQISTPVDLQPGSSCDLAPITQL